MDCAGLNQIEVALGTFNDHPDQPVIFFLSTDISGEEILYSETFDGHTVTDYQRRSFRFPPISDSTGRTFFFYLTSPTATESTTITGRGYSDVPVDHYPAGQALGGRLGQLHPLQADVAFTAYCDLTMWQKLQAIFDD
jgi:hypothetical protein